MQRKCCAHCPGSSSREPHECGVPVYVAGSLRSSGRPAKSAKPAKRQEPARPASGKGCADRFATAKKFHKENLQHQPLPDRCDDAIFTADKPAVEPCMCDIVRRCQRLVPRRQPLRKKQQEPRGGRYAPALGCKKPETWMDLAICWETPLDPAYEPVRPVHIDGSDGGPAPAVFSLVQHSCAHTDVRDNSIPSQRQREDCNTRHQTCDNCRQEEVEEEEEGEEVEPVDGDLSRKLESLRLGGGARARRARFQRHCGACEAAGGPRPKPRHTRVLAGGKRSNGLAAGAVPRPRTPYARRSFCIDSLAPPFSVMQGCRDADYPEHWRLTSIYQQSYRNPRAITNYRTS